MADEKGSYLQTVGRALEVLSLFGECNGMTLSQLAERLGMSTTVAYRLLFTLCKDGFLEQDRETKKYTLGRKILLLGYRAMQSQDLVREALPLMEELSRLTGRNVMLTVRADWKSLCVEKVETEGELQLSMKARGIYPIHQGASNRPLLAYASEEERGTYIASLGLWEWEEEELRDVLKEIRKKGYDYSEGVLTPGAFAVGYPVFELGNRLAGVLSLGGYSGNLEPEKLETYIKETGKAAARLSRLLGAER